MFTWVLRYAIMALEPHAKAGMGKHTKMVQAIYEG